MNSFTTLGLPICNTTRNIKIESKKTKAQCVPYFFSTIKTDSKLVAKKNNKSVKI